MITGFDCYSPVTLQVAQRARSAGMEFVCRYYGSSGSRKLLLPSEVEILKQTGLKIFPVFELSDGRPLAGLQAGRDDAASVLEQAKRVGQPVGTTICFAVDKDVDFSRTVVRTVVEDYFREINKVLNGKYLVGAYASGEVLGYLLEDGLIKVAWLAGAMGWRGSRLFDAQARWHMKQGPTIPVSDAHNKLGIDYDPNEAVSWERIDAWDPNNGHPQVEPDKPKLSTGPIDLFVIQRALKDQGFYDSAIDGVVVDGGATVRGLVAYSAKHRPAR